MHARWAPRMDAVEVGNTCLPQARLPGYTAGWVPRMLVYSIHLPALVGWPGLVSPGVALTRYLWDLSKSIRLVATLSVPSRIYSPRAKPRPAPAVLPGLAMAGHVCNGWARHTSFQDHPCSGTAGLSGLAKAGRACDGLGAAGCPCPCGSDSCIPAEPRARGGALRHIRLHKLGV